MGTGCSSGAQGGPCVSTGTAEGLAGKYLAFSVTFMTSKRGQYCCSVLNILVIRFCECHLPLKNI